MEPGVAERSRVWRYLAAGVETGVVAVLVMLGWLGLAALWYRKSFWTPPNLLAISFYGESALRNRFAATTFSGLALYLLIYGGLGALFALAVREHRNRLRITCLGMLAAIAWYYLSYGLLWKSWHPLIVLYTHDRPMFVGHVLYGALLGSYPRYLRRLWPRKAPALPLAVPAGYGNGSTETTRESA